jgi:hypothetical protein
LPGVFALRQGRRGSGQLGRSRDARSGSLGPAPRTALAYVGKAPWPGRAVRANGRGVNPRDWLAPQALCLFSHPHPLTFPSIPWPPGNSECPSSNPLGKYTGSELRPAAATSESARARARLAPRTCQEALGGPLTAAHPHLILRFVDGCGEATYQPTGFVGRGRG